VYTAPQSPRSIGGVLDDSIELFKASFRRCWLATLLLCVALVLFSVWMQVALLGTTRSAAGQGMATLLAVYGSPQVWLGYLAIIAVSLLVNLMLSVTVLDISRGRPAGDALGRFGVALRWLPGALAATALLLVACVTGIVLMVIPGIYLIVRWVLWVVAYADERRGPLAALRTSWRLVGGHWWRTALILTVITVVTFVVSMVLVTVLAYVSEVMALDQATRLIASQVMQGLLQVLYLPAFTVSLVAIYNDLRLRKEGGDLQARLAGLETSRA
jgi:hypothetical protein